MPVPVRGQSTVSDQILVLSIHEIYGSNTRHQTHPLNRTGILFHQTPSVRHLEYKFQAAKMDFFHTPYQNLLYKKFDIN